MNGSVDEQHLSERLRTMVAAECVCLAVLAAVLPVLLHPRFDILDCASFCDIARNARWSDPATFLFPQFLDNRARPGYFIMLLPAYVSMNPGVHYWYQTVVLLIAPMLGLFALLRSIMQRVWLAAAGVVAVLCVQPFVENYYTLCKGETWTLAGCICMSLLLWRALFGGGRPRRVSAFLAAILVYAIKETGIAYVGTYVVALAVLGWASELPWRTVLKRTVWLTAANAAGCGLFLVFFLRLDTQYSADGTAGYGVASHSLLTSMARTVAYVVDTSPYVLLLLPLLSCAYEGGTRGIGEPRARRHVRVVAAWIVYFLALAASMAVVLLPWQNFVPRYMLVSAAAVAVASVLGIDLAWRLSRSLPSAVWRRACAALGAALCVLLLVHMAYSVMVGIWSEGRCRQHFDQAYDDMFQYVARNTPTNGTAYFLMNHTIPEPLQNTVIGMRLFYGRPDIKCEFPVKQDDMVEPGLLAVSTIDDFHFNYSRTPTHYAVSLEFPALFPQGSLPPLYASFVPTTPLWYALPTYEREQYESVWGIPAFWGLSREQHAFGWNIYWFKGEPTRTRTVPVHRVKRTGGARPNMLANGDFGAGLAAWSPWSDAIKCPDVVRCVEITNANGLAHGIVIGNSKGAMVGLKQVVPLESGAVYRLSAVVRAPRGKFEASRMLGARLSCFVPDQPEYDTVWLFDDCDEWTEQEVVFTNAGTQPATVLLHMGYGAAKATGEFADVRLEKVR